MLRIRRASLLRAGSGLSALPPGWTAVLTVLFPTLFIFSFYFFLFSPLLPALLLLSLHSPCRLWPLWQPTDERSWVYSPLHYSAQLHSVSDEESDTVSVQQPCAGCLVGQGQSLCSLCKVSLASGSVGLLHGCGRARLPLRSALCWQSPSLLSKGFDLFPVVWCRESFGELRFSRRCHFWRM